MNLPKQSRPVMRDVTRAPITAQVEGAQPSPPIGEDPNPGLRLIQCLQFCRNHPNLGQFCINQCYAPPHIVPDLPI